MDAPGKEAYYCSSNKEFCFVVVPKRIESTSKYFKEKQQKGAAGQAKPAQENVCKGILLKRTPGDPRVWSRVLSNEVAPVHALVSNDGEYVVTFDNWHSIGYGDDVVVIYGPKGQLVRKFSLEDILGYDARNVRHTVSSRHWREGAFIDKSGQILVLKARVVSIWTKLLEFFTKEKDGGDLRVILIQLETGRFVEVAWQ